MIKVNLMSVARTHWRPLGTLALLVVMVGCSGSIATVSGKVTYNGEPVENGYISFRPSDGRGKSFATPISNGQYRAENAVPGAMIVVITGVKDVNYYASSAESYKMAEEARKAGTLQADVAEAADYIAPDAEGNSKQVEIQPGDQVIDFSITGAPKS